MHTNEKEINRSLPDESVRRAMMQSQMHGIECERKTLR